ncbi:nucleotidyltransferase family protein [Winogradskyella sp. PG-2]|uniref:nucleotidyltransferase family protein n=1 Tax=Winogradskyella sp. PG-2 TaxID=754409 RepID=UPI0004586939|nr:nucleotidyltransferase family protein [Winogradskyella sp. PG-2]BAO76964.1 molybdopterin cytidylyltransferase [Winogradskyella sp. PG-2]
MSNYNFNVKQNISILILAAGNSNRMGTSKQLLPVGKTTLLGVTIENALLSNANKVYCVLGANAKIITESISNYNVDTIFNSKYKSGLSSSIVKGIEHIEEENLDAVLILLGDQPFIESIYINEIIDAYTKHDKTIIASLYKTSLGVPALIPKKYFNDLLKLKGDNGAKSFFKTQKENIISIKNGKLMDIDTKEQYQDFINSSNSE